MRGKKKKDGVKKVHSGAHKRKRDKTSPIDERGKK